jgi:VPDSG-CTERM motif
MKMKNETSLVTVPSRSSLRKHAFYGILALVSLLGLGITQSASAYLVTLEEVGPNVVATGSGVLDFFHLNFNSFVPAQAQIDPSGGTILVGIDPNGPLEDLYTGSITGPTSFGSGGLTNPSSGSGFLVGINGALDQIFLPEGVLNTQPLPGTSTYNGATFASLGVTPGTYVWTWGTGANENFTLQIGPAGAVPDAGSTLPLLSLASLGLVALRRKLRC